jgi:hypothetical protein
VDAVRADQDVACDSPAVGDRHGQPVPVLLESLDARIQMDAGVTEGMDQNVEQVGAVNLVVGRAKMCLCPLAERGSEDALAGVPGTVVSPLRVDGDARQRLAQPQGPEYPGRIRTELDAGSDLPRGVRLLEQLGVDAPLPECESGGNSTDAATGDQDPEITPLMDFSVYPFNPWNLTGTAASCCELVHVQRQIQGLLWPVKAAGRKPGPCPRPGLPRKPVQRDTGQKENSIVPF